MASSEDFDPFQQSFTLVLLDGTPLNITMPDLDDFVRYSIQISINYAAQLGASLIFLIVLLLLTKPEKRKSPVFILNSLALAINVIRNLLQCLYYTGSFSETYAYFSQDYSKVTPSDYASQVTITVLNLLLLVCAESSLIMQVWVICITLRDSYKQGVTAFLVLVACLAIGFRFAFTIENAKLILSLNPPTSLNWLASASNIATTISVCLFSAMFITKLGFALEQRRQLGMNHFGPMQILFIMGCQTLLIPGTCEHIWF
ncbi:MAG: hypothetical protein Q9167_004793 [Letrouitia subvulpina]